MSARTRIVYKGIEGTVAELATVFGEDPSCVRKRLKRGWSVERALEEPSRWRAKLRLGQRDAGPT